MHSIPTKKTDYLLRKKEKKNKPSKELIELNPVQQERSIYLIAEERMNKTGDVLIYLSQGQQ
jgi:hypothetical protein